MDIAWPSVDKVFSLKRRDAHCIFSSRFQFGSEVTGNEEEIGGGVGGGVACWKRDTDGAGRDVAGRGGEG